MLFVKPLMNIGGSRGRGGRAIPLPHPRGLNSFNFMQFFGKFGKIVCWHLEGCHPHLEEFLDPPLMATTYLGFFRYLYYRYQPDSIL